MANRSAVVVWSDRRLKGPGPGQFKIFRKPCTDFSESGFIACRLSSYPKLLCQNEEAPQLSLFSTNQNFTSSHERPYKG